MQLALRTLIGIGVASCLLALAAFWRIGRVRAEINTEVLALQETSRNWRVTRNPSIRADLDLDREADMYITGASRLAEVPSTDLEALARTTTNELDKLAQDVDKHKGDVVAVDLQVHRMAAFVTRRAVNASLIRMATLRRSLESTKRSANISAATGVVLLLACGLVLVTRALTRNRGTRSGLDTRGG